MIAKPSWKIRRAIIIGSLIFCAIVIGYLTFFGEDTRLAETIALCAFGMATTVISGYVFGAVIEDVSLAKTLAARSAKQDDTL